MPYSLPSYSELRASVLAAILASGQVPNGLLPVSILRTIGDCVAQNAFLHGEYLRWIALQSVPWTCTGEFLDAWASVKGIVRNAATSATSAVQFDGTNTTPIPPGTTVQRVGDQIAYQTTASATITGGVATAPVVATTTGSSTNGDTGISVILTTPITGVSPSAVFTSPATGGTDPETDASLRTRMLKAFQALGEGGSVANYIEWSLDVPGVTRAWCNPSGAGAGTAVVYVMLDGADSVEGGFPQGTNGVATAETRWPIKATGDQLTVANALQSREPATALVFVFAPVARHVPIVIQSLSNNTPTIQANIIAALQVLCLSSGTPLGTTIFPSSISAAIQSAAVGATFTLVSPTTPVTMHTGLLPVVQTADVTFQ